MKKIILISLVSFSLFSCKKNVEADNTATAVKDEVTLRPNVFIMDSTVFKLNNDSVLIKQNKFEFILSNSTIPTYKIGDIIVIATNDGYIQKIANISNSTGKVIYTTTNVAMDEVIENGSFSFNMNSDSLRVVQRGYTQNLSNITLSGNSQYSLRLDSGNVTFDPDWKFDFDFKKTGGLNKFELSCANSVLNANFDLLFSASGNLNLDRIDTLKKLTKTFTKSIPVVIFGVPALLPVKVVMDVRLLVRSKLNVSGAFSRKVNISSNNTFGVGVKYENNQWNGIYNFTPVTNFTVKQTTGLLGYNYDFYLYPEISFKLYNVAGPYASVALRSNINGNLALSGDKDQNAYTWLQTTIGAKATILGRTLFDYSRMWNTDSLKYNAPFEIKRISGDAQIGQANQNLPLPIKVRILDSKGDAQPDVPVYFNVTSGGGSVSAVKVLTDINGYAESIWRIGGQSSLIQYLSVSAKKANGTLIKDAPLEFAATANANNSNTVTDIDGNVYDVIQIGTQFWMQQNLKTSRYNDGMPILTSLTNTAWPANSSGAYAIYENVASNNNTYGKSYNWYAVNSGKLAPAGWHVPTDTEWTTLINYLGGINVAGGKMKTATLWISPNTDATNSSGYSGLPAGVRNGADGSYIHMNNASFFWSFTSYNTDYAWNYSLNYNQAGVVRNYNSKTNGFSVRCIKN